LPGSKYCIFHLEKSPLVLAAVLGAVASLGLFEVWRTIVPSTESRQLEGARKEIADVRAQHETAKTQRRNLEREVLSLRAELAESEAQAAYQQAELERQLRLRAEELAALSKRTLNAVTGGDSFCYLSIHRSNAETGHFMFIHQGDHTLYDLTVRIVDLDRFEERRGSLSLDDLDYTDTNISLGTQIAGHSSLRGKVNLSTLPHRGYNVFFAARNGSFHQVLRSAYDDGTLRQALKVIRDEKTILERVDDGYPRDESGSVQWQR